MNHLQGRKYRQNCLLAIAVALFLTGCTETSEMSDSQKRGQIAFDQIIELGANAVWESDLVVVSFSGVSINDDDLLVFRDFPFVQILSLSNTSITDEGLMHLENLSNLESLSLSGTKVTAEGVERLRRALPKAEVDLSPPDTSAINPFTGEPFDSQ